MLCFLEISGRKHRLREANTFEDGSFADRIGANNNIHELVGLKMDGFDPSQIFNFYVLNPHLPQPARWLIQTDLYFSDIASGGTRAEGITVHFTPATC